MISVVVPVYNERGNLESLIHEIVHVAKKTPISEIIYVDDGSTDGSFEELERMRPDIPMLRIVRHAVRSGQSAAFLSGVRAAGNSLIVFMDGDGQNDPKDIETLYARYQKKSSTHKKIMIAGQRVKRQDNVLRRLASVWANKIRSAFLHDHIRDTGCSLKLVQRDDYLHLPYFDHMHRFLPALLQRDGVIVEVVDVSHRPRSCGISKYGFWDRLIVGMVDLLGVKWLIGRGMPKDFSVREIL